MVPGTVSYAAKGLAVMNRKMGLNKAHAIGNICARKLNQFVAESRVDMDERLVSGLSFSRRLSALRISGENLAPGWRNEYAGRITQIGRRALAVCSNRKTAKPSVSEHIGHAAIEEDRSLERLRLRKLLPDEAPVAAADTTE